MLSCEIVPSALPVYQKTVHLACWQSSTVRQADQQLLHWGGAVSVPLLNVSVCRAFLAGSRE